MNIGDFKAEAFATIDGFRRGRVSLARLASRLEQLLEVTDDLPESWREQYFVQWMVVEEVNAVRLDRRGQPADDKEDRTLSSAIDRLCTLLAELRE